MGIAWKQKRQSNFCLQFRPEEKWVQQAESSDVSLQTWRVEEFWSQDVSECGFTARLLIDHKVAFSLSADLRDKKGVLRE